MNIVIVNGHTCETGLVLDGHFGWHNHRRMLETAEDLGWEIDDELRECMDRYDDDTSDLDEFPNDPEIISDAMDEAERWLNDHTNVQCATCGAELIWHDDSSPDLEGNVFEPEWVHAPELPSTCGTVDPRHFTWHWSDGEFFLSPLCENGDCDDETCAHWD